MRSILFHRTSQREKNKQSCSTVKFRGFGDRCWHFTTSVSFLLLTTKSCLSLSYIWLLIWTGLLYLYSVTRWNAHPWFTPVFMHSEILTAPRIWSSSICVPFGINIVAVCPVLHVKCRVFFCFVFFVGRAAGLFKKKKKRCVGQRCGFGFQLRYRMSDILHQSQAT